MIYYISESSLHSIFTFVSERYSKLEEVPQYEHEVGFDKFCSVLKQAQDDTYYPSLIDKSAYILIGINKGHFFSNGNKRLALVMTIVFLGINRMALKMSSKEAYKDMLQSLFPEYNQWEDFAEFTSTDYATYNLSIMIADSGTHDISHDELKRRVKSFLNESLVAL